MEIFAGLIFLVVMAAVATAAGRRIESGSSKPLDPMSGLAGDSVARMSVLLSAWRGGRSSAYQYSASENESGLRFVLQGLHRSVTLSRPGHYGTVGGAAVDIGDPDLQRSLLVSGSRSHVLALLTADARTALRNVLLGTVRIGQLTLDDGTLTVDVPTAGFDREHPGLPQAARVVVELANRLGPSLDVVARLAENATRDPLPGVRLANLRALAADYAADPRARAAIAGALRDVASPVRLEAALASGAQGRETLLALAVDTSVDHLVSTRALAGLGPHLPLDRIEPLVQEAEKHPPQAGGRAERVRALVAALAARPSGDALPLLERLARDAHDAHGPLVVETIVASHRAQAEGALVRTLLGQDPARGSIDFIPSRPRTQEAAARHLGLIGTIEAVEPLKQTAQRHGGGIAATARQSIAQIRERLADTRGQLALTDSEAGRLSEATDPTGRVSLPDEKG